ncbi:circularly permuted type 2 ATP-grasp protein [Balneatrix alpica]|uniref:Circularly permuted type 2 ATP-grasp protein n=1 Tax=Balneatrix alpica TaxID=75684 RepID=A0ABV5ZD78_9GAMM|nr:circularly permuted type 2 ATP-grasp protein [Balneatrix alpica]
MTELPSQPNLPTQDASQPGWYPGVAGSFDEAFAAGGQPRQHWQFLYEAISQMGNSVLAERQKKAQHILRDDGATYNLSADSFAQQPWALDVLPNLIDSQEWHQLEAGLIERAQLFDLILKDFYGPRLLLQEGILPAEILYGHPGFLRACQGLFNSQSPQLVLHAADLARAPNGQFQVIGDRTQTPNGSGFALENRIVCSKVMPLLYRNQRVHRLSHFFQTLKHTLSDLAPKKTESPLIVVLTPGAYNESYFEHAYLSNYLGYPLVQGGDLSVRNGHVWLKSLHGLIRVDVILRFVVDHHCDQVELSSNSLHGVPGLLEVVRAGNVVVSNPLGSGVLETPALLKFLPQISRFLLGHEPKLGSVQTWWCGDAEDRAYVESNLQDLIIKPAVRHSHKPSIYGHRLSEKDQQRVLAAIERAPHQYVAQPYLAASHVPTWHEQQLHSRPALLRTFAVAYQDSYTLMAGGLTRVGLSDQQSLVKSQGSPVSKDTWVLADEHEQVLGASSASTPFQDVAQQVILPSRVLENFFWLGRYAERAEASLRLMRTLLLQLNNLDPLPEQGMAMLYRALSGQIAPQTDATFSEAELIQYVLDAKQPNSIRATLNALLNCTEEVKEMLSADTRRIVNDLRDHLKELDQAFAEGLPSAAEESLDPLVTSLLALAGLNNESMLRGVSWKFQEMGRRTERALQIVSLLNATLTERLDELPQHQMLESVLQTMEAMISFRRRYRSRAKIEHGLDLLLVDPSNPRSLLYQLELLRRYLDELPQPVGLPSQLPPEKRLVLEALSQVQLADLAILASSEEPSGKRAKLQAFTQLLDRRLKRFATQLSDKYFDHTAGPQQLVHSQWEGEL